MVWVFFLFVFLFFSSREKGELHRQSSLEPSIGTHVEIDSPLVGCHHGARRSDRTVSFKFRGGFASTLPICSAVVLART